MGWTRRRPGPANAYNPSPGRPFVVLPAEVELRAQRAVLENAVAHDGAAKTTAVVARLLATDAALRPRAEEVREFVSQFVATIEGVPMSELSDRLDRLGGPEAGRVVVEKTEGGVFPDLPGAIDGKVVLRMAPFPNGVLHIGHGRLLFVHDYYRTRYHGKILLVFDDTIGSAEKRVELEFYDLIQGDCELAGVRPDAVIYRSDRIAAQYPWARRVIDKGGAYVCRCPAEELRENRVKGAPCPERAQTPAETMDEWERMLGNAYGPGEAVLRLRTGPRRPRPCVPGPGPVPHQRP